MTDFEHLLSLAVPVLPPQPPQFAELIAASKQAADTLAGLQKALTVENSLRDADNEDEELDKALDKEAFSMTATGDVQGVHLRATLHKLLDKYQAGGLATNDARTGQVRADIDADPETVKKILAEFTAKMQANPRVHAFSLTPSEQKERLRRVEFDDKKLQRMFDRQGFTSFLGFEHDPSAYRRHWVQKRYRLQEDPTTRNLVGNVSDLAYKQLTGREPVYDTQLQHPEAFARPYWMKTLPPPMPKTPEEFEPPKVDLAKAASPNAHLAEDTFVPRIVAVKYAEDAKRKTPYTIALDLDGTLAVSLEPFDPDKIGPVREEMRGWAKRFHEAGARIIIWTCRGDEKQVAKWLKDNDVRYDYINVNPDQVDGMSEKIVADVYVDDKGRDAARIDSDGPEILAAIEEHGGDKKEPRRLTLQIERMTIKILLDPSEVLDEIYNFSERD